MLVFDTTTQYPAAISISALRYDFQTKTEEKRRQDTLFLFLFQISDNTLTHAHICYPISQDHFNMPLHQGSKLLQQDFIVSWSTSS